MIENTPEYTEPLTGDEIHMANVILGTMIKNHNDKSKPCTGSRIVKGMRERGYKCNSVRVRKIINYLRMDGQPIVCTSKGYWVTNDRAEIEKQIKSLSQRRSAILAAENGLKRLLK